MAARDVAECDAHRAPDGELTSIRTTDRRRCWSSPGRCPKYWRMTSLHVAVLCRCSEIGLAGLVGEERLRSGKVAAGGAYA